MIYLITGLPRSGASAVAQLIHRAGVPTAYTVFAPTGGKRYPEWEDREITTSLLTPDRNKFTRFLYFRRDLAEVTHDTTNIGLKSPLLAAHHVLVEECVRHTVHDQFRWIIVERPRSKVDASLKKAAWFSDKIVDQVAKGLEEIDGLRLQFDNFLRQPHRESQYLFQKLGWQPTEPLGTLVPKVFN